MATSIMLTFNQQVEAARQRQAALQEILQLSQPDAFLSALQNAKFKSINQFFKHFAHDSATLEKVINFYWERSFALMISYSNSHTVTDLYFLECLQVMIKHLKDKQAAKLQLMQLHQHLTQAYKANIPKTANLINHANSRINITEYVIKLSNDILSSPISKAQNKEVLAQFRILSSNANKEHVYWQQQKEHATQVHKTFLSKNPTHHIRLNALVTCHKQIQAILGPNCCQKEAEFQKNLKTLRTMR